MVTVTSPSEVLTVNVSPLRKVITPLSFTLSLLPMANAGRTTEVSWPKKQAVMTIFLVTIIHASFKRCVFCSGGHDEGYSCGPLSIAAASGKRYSRGGPSGTINSSGEGTKTCQSWLAGNWGL